MLGIRTEIRWWYRRQSLWWLQPWVFIQHIPGGSQRSETDRKQYSLQRKRLISEEWRSPIPPAYFFFSQVWTRLLSSCCRIFKLTRLLFWLWDSVIIPKNGRNVSKCVYVFLLLRRGCLYSQENGTEYFGFQFVIL